MKRACIFTLLLALCLISACRLSDMRTMVIQIPQVTNDACETRVRGALQSLKGVDMNTLVFDRAAGTLTVRYESMIIAHKNIEHAIIAVGFDANELTADEAARAALPADCLGITTTSNAPAVPSEP